MNKQFIVGKERDSAKRFRIFRQGSRREIDLDLQRSIVEDSNPINNPQFGSQRPQKHRNRDFKDIKKQIIAMKNDLGSFLGEKKTLSESQHLQFATLSPKSPVSFSKYLSSQLVTSQLEKQNSSFLSEQSEENFYKTKYNLLSEQLQCVKRNYLVKKLKYKETIHKLEKRVGFLSNIINRNELDIEEYKNLLGNELRCIKRQLTDCTQSQIIGRAGNGGQGRGIEELQAERLNYSLILDPTQGEYQNIELKELVESKQFELAECMDTLEKIKLQNLHLEDLLETKEKQEMEVKELRNEKERQRFILDEIVGRLKEEKQLSNRYKEELMQSDALRQLDYDNFMQQQMYLRRELENSLLKLSSVEIEFREIQRQRQQKWEGVIEQKQKRLVDADTKLFQLKTQLSIKQTLIQSLSSQQLSSLPPHIPSSSSDKQSQELELLKVENRQLKEELQNARNTLDLSSRKMEQIKSKYEQQLYNQEIQSRRKSMEFQDKIQYYMEMVKKEVSDTILREQDFQLLEKEQEIQKLNIQLLELRGRLCCLEGQIITKDLSDVVSFTLHHPSKRSLIASQYKNQRYEQMVSQLMTKLECLEVSKRKQCMESKQPESHKMEQEENNESPNPEVSQAIKDPIDSNLETGKDLIESSASNAN